MRRLWLLAALWLAKAAWLLSRFLGRGRGSSLPGVVALKIYPGILRWFARQPRYGTIMVTGTNGKTTTSNMLARILNDRGYRVLANYEGANLITGVAAAFVRRADLLGRVDCDYGVLEVDEAAFPGISSRVCPLIVLVTNFFRDQLDRYGELDTTIKTVAGALSKMKGIKLVLNADDPLVAQLKQKTGLNTLFYGVDAGRTGKAGSSEETREAKFCPFCGSPLAYSTYNYSQLGDFACPGCRFRRPLPGVRATVVEPERDFFHGHVSYLRLSFSLDVPAGGIYDFYNALAAVSAAAVLGVEPGDAAKALRSYRPVLGRMDRFEYNGKTLLLNLVKNPTGFNQALEALLNRDGMQDVLMAINDNAADGRDVSWLWDVDFEILAEKQERFNVFICTGQRAEDMAVRLKYAGVPTARIILQRDMETAVERVMGGDGEAGFLLATYTALWPVEAILARRAERDERYAQGMSSVS